MSLDRQGGRRPSRRAREQRAYQLSLAAAGSGAVAIVTLVLALVGVVGLGIPLLAIIATVVFVVLFRRAVSND